MQCSRFGNVHHLTDLGVSPVDVAAAADCEGL